MINLKEQHGKRFRVILNKDEKPNQEYIVPHKYGSAEFPGFIFARPTGGLGATVACSRRQFTALQKRMGEGNFRIAQEADTEWVISFKASKFDTISNALRARKRRQYTPEQLKKAQIQAKKNLHGDKLKVAI